MALRAALVVVLGLPILMLPVVLRWRNGSWDPCVWQARNPTVASATAATNARTEAVLEPEVLEDPAVRPAEAAVPDTGGSLGQCLRSWADEIAG